MHLVSSRHAQCEQDHFYRNHQRIYQVIANTGKLLLALMVVAGVLILAPATTRAADVPPDRPDFHVVRIGESLAGIAQQYGLTQAELSRFNGIEDPNLIVIGQHIDIPPLSGASLNVVAADAGVLPGDDGYYTVVRGDSLSQVAKRFDLSLADLMRLNGMEDANTVYVGQVLRVTARVEPVALSSSTEPELAQEIYVVQEGDTLAGIAKQSGLSVEELMITNGLPHPDAVWTGQRLRMQQPTPRASTFGVAGAPEDGHRWIEIDLSDQTLTAWQGDVSVLYTTVSTGKAATPTVVGDFAVNLKYDSQRMTGDDYDLPGVPWVMYFYADYAIHGAYWHTNFGTPQSHGCVNMRVEEAETLYNWAAEGTQVVVHE